LKTIEKLAQAFRRTAEGMKKFVQVMQLLARIPEDKFEAKIAELCADPVKPQQATVPEQANPRYLQSITVVTLFFAALLGFGLNHILEAEHTEKGSIIAHHRWEFFFVAVFIFVRFLTGSANHLWLEYVKNPREDPETWFGLNQDYILFTVDLATLTIFGCLGVAMCYSENENTFFIYTASLLGTALFWSVLDWYRRRHWREEIGNWSPPWIWLNLIQLYAVIWVWKPWWVLLSIFLQPWHQYAVIWVWKAWGAPLLGQPLLLLQQWLPPWCVIACSVGPVDTALSYRLVDLAIISALILAVDFYAQLSQLGKDP
jgi:hypothetical protein